MEFLLLVRDVARAVFMGGGGGGGCPRILDS